MKYKENIAISFYKVKEDMKIMKKEIEKIKDNQTQILLFLNKLKTN